MGAAARVEQLVRAATQSLALPDVADMMRSANDRLVPAAIRLGELGWTVPMWATPAFLIEIAALTDADDIDRVFVRQYRAKRLVAFREMISEMLTRASLGRWSHLLQQADRAYRRRDYLIVVPSLLLVVEGLLALSEGSMTRRTRARGVTKRHLRGRREFRAVLWTSVDAFVQCVFKDQDFAGPRPQVINRHWILHGRDAASAREADCLRLFQAIEILSYLVDAGAPQGGARLTRAWSWRAPRHRSV